MIKIIITAKISATTILKGKSMENLANLTLRQNDNDGITISTSNGYADNKNNSL